MPGEVSPLNPAARREVGGVWNEDNLPILEWEIAEERVVLPEDLQILLGLETPVLRWRRSKYEQVMVDHDQPIEQRARRHLSAWLSRWERAGAEPGKSETWRVFLREAGRWVVVVIGRDREGSLNLITVHSPSDKKYVPNMLAKGEYAFRGVREQEK
jgi:hypothetical protein